jgi:peptidoglycan/LPS O-acetylase OafA/YrhL
MTQAVETHPHGGERLHALDAVRGYALLAGIVFHSILSFLPSKEPMWVVIDNAPSETLAIVFYVLHIFRMATFFLIAGFFAHLTFHRRGQKAFIKDRLKRIGIPLVAFWPISFSSIVAVTLWAVYVANGGKFPPPPPPNPDAPAFPFPLTHLWFLYVLLLLYAVTLAVRALMARIDGKGALRAGLDKAVAALVGNILSPVVLAVPVALALYAETKWRWWLGIPTPDQSLAPNLPALVAFGSAFGLGWLVHRQPDLIRVWERRWVLNLIAAVGFTAASLHLAGIAPSLTVPPQDMTRLTYAVCYALAIWTWVFAAIGMALKFLSGFSATRRYIADASYWLYLIHLPIVMVMQQLVAHLSWPWPVKFAVILGVAFPLMFASYQVMVRYTWIGALLNGKRAERPGSKPRPTKARKVKPA